VGASDAGFEGHVEGRARLGFHAVDHPLGAVDSVALDPVEFGQECVGLLDAVAEQVDAQLPRVDPKLHPADERHAVADGHRCGEVRMNPVVVRDGHGGQSCFASAFGDLRQPQPTVGGGRVDV
jgi:hypothetical protein